MNDKNLKHRKPRLSLGPIQFFWPRERVFEFYRDIAESPVDIIYLGETVCAKRTQMQYKHWLQIAESLKHADKEVVLSGMTLLESTSDLKRLERLCQEVEYTIEANDFAAIELLHAAKREFVTGPSINIYNRHSLDLLARQGLKRWTLSVELGQQALVILQSMRPEGLETEVFVWGKLPLAYSARCFTARSHSLPKDDCQLRCLDYPDGLLMSTREGEAFLNINGIQTQSAKTCSLHQYTDQLTEMNVDVWRISPQSKHMMEIIDLFDQHRHRDIQDNTTMIEDWTDNGICNGYWSGSAGMSHTSQWLEGQQA